MAPGYPSLFLPKYEVSTRYNPATLECSPSHATLVNRTNKKKLQQKGTKTMNKTLDVVAIWSQGKKEEKGNCSDYYSCTCKCHSEINDTGLKAKQDEQERKLTEERNKDIETKETKGKGKRYRPVSERFKGSERENDKVVNPETGDIPTQDVAKSDENGIFDTQEQERDEKSTKDVSKSKTITADAKKSYNSSKPKPEPESTVYRKAISYSNNSYITEVENKTTDHCSNASTDNDLDENSDQNNRKIMEDNSINVRIKPPKIKHMNGSRMKERRSSISLQDDYDLNKLVMDGEEIE